MRHAVACKQRLVEKICEIFRIKDLFASISWHWFAAEVEDSANSNDAGQMGRWDAFSIISPLCGNSRHPGKLATLTALASRSSKSLRPTCATQCDLLCMRVIFQYMKFRWQSWQRAGPIIYTEYHQVLYAFEWLTICCRDLPPHARGCTDPWR